MILLLMSDITDRHLSKLFMRIILTKRDPRFFQHAFVFYRVELSLLILSFLSINLIRILWYLFAFFLDIWMLRWIMKKVARLWMIASLVAATKNTSRQKASVIFPAHWADYNLFELLSIFFNFLYFQVEVEYKIIVFKTHGHSCSGFIRSSEWQPSPQLGLTKPQSDWDPPWPWNLQSILERAFLPLTGLILLVISNNWIK